MSKRGGATRTRASRRALDSKQLTVRVHHKIVDVLRLGYSFQTGCDFVGLPIELVAEWVSAGQKAQGEDRLQQFAEDVLTNYRPRQCSPDRDCACQECADARRIEEDILMSAAIHRCLPPRPPKRHQPWKPE